MVRHENVNFTTALQKDRTFMQGFYPANTGVPYCVLIPLVLDAHLHNVLVDLSPDLSLTRIHIIREASMCLRIKADLKFTRFTYLYGRKISRGCLALKRGKCYSQKMSFLDPSNCC